MLELLIDTIIPFLFILTVLVFVHELGHYIAAIKNGVKVEVFSIGFGKELFGYTDKSGTRWKFSLVPLGGYVKMYGDFIFSFFVLVFINCYFGFSLTKPIISEVELDSPAYKAGLKEGDIILEVNDKKIEDFSSLRDIIGSSSSDTLKILYSRGNKIDYLETKVINKNIGIRGTVESVKLDIVESIFKSAYQIFYFVKVTLVGIYDMISGSRGTEDLGGPIRIAELSGDFWSKGVQSTLWFMMIISLNLGLINLFPIPMLDGGHLLLNFIEYLKGSPLNQKSLEIIHSIGLFLLLSLMVFATYNDVLRIIR